MDEAAVHLDLPAADDPHAAGEADPRLVVAVHVGTHGQLGLLLGRVEQRAGVLFCFCSFWLHTVSSDSSLAELSSARMFAASSSGSAPRRIVPEIGQVSTRSPVTRTYISGDAPTRHSPSPRLNRNSYGAGLRSRSRS